MRNVFIAGVGQTAFGRFPDRSLSSLTEEAVRAALAAAGVSEVEVGLTIFANGVAGLLTGQEMVRGQMVLRDTRLAGGPIVNVENACASSSSAAHLAWMAVASEAYEIVLAVGAERLTVNDKAKTLRAIASAADVEELDHLAADLSSRTGSTSGSFFMDVYAEAAAEYMARSGATPFDFAKVVVKNHRHAASNPKAQFRTAVTVGEVLASRRIAGPLTLFMCSPVSDGAAAVLFCSSEVVSRLGADAVRVRASSLVSGRRSEHAAVGRAAQLAYASADLGPEDIDVAEVHDASAAAELTALEDIGLCPPGDAPKWLAACDLAVGGRLPVNTGGGLLCRGHPIGATGCAQLVELTDQLRGRAGRRQVAGARVGLAENAGGYIGPDPAAAVVTILSRN